MKLLYFLASLGLAACGINNHNSNLQEVQRPEIDPTAGVIVDPGPKTGIAEVFEKGELVGSQDLGFYYYPHEIKLNLSNINDLYLNRDRAEILSLSKPLKCSKDIEPCNAKWHQFVINSQGELGIDVADGLPRNVFYFAREIAENPSQLELIEGVTMTIADLGEKSGLCEGSGDFDLNICTMHRYEFRLKKKSTKSWIKLRLETET